MKINTLTIDSTKSLTQLCSLGAHFGTDKTPYSKNAHHRHPYSAVYDLLFSAMRNSLIVVGEVGILDNASMHMWRAYFSKALLFGFEYAQEKIDKAISDNLDNTFYFQTDVSNASHLKSSLKATSMMFDVLIDDSTHLFEHQIIFIDVAIDFVKPGGLIIVEDIFRAWADERYTSAIEHLERYFDWSSFIDAKHDLGYSEGTVVPYFDNDKILVLRRNATRRRDDPKFQLTENQRKPTLKIFMATHKPYAAPDDDGYFAVQAGAALYEDFGLFRDDEGLHISGKNAHYSEMTVHYWIWKNVIADWVGLVHYRRHFGPRNESLSHRGQRIASSQDLIAELSDVDLVLIEPIDLMQPETNVRYTVEGQYIHSHGYDIMTARKVISESCAQYLASFDLIMRNSRLIPYNLMIARKDIFDEYSSWLFDILFAVEKLVQLTSRGRHQGRVLAFLSERLLTVWIAHNWNKLKISFRPHVFFGDL